MSLKKHSLEVEGKLADYAANAEFDSLVQAGCNRDQLLFLLEWSFWTDESWNQLLGMDLLAFKAAIKQIRNCADKIARLARSELHYHVSIELQLPAFIALNEAPILSKRLHEYADKLEWLRLGFGPEHRLRLHVWKAYIVAMVLEDTKRAHDSEVSHLISAVLKDSRYSEKSHQGWRLRHQGFIKQERRRLRDRRSRQVVPPPTVASTS